MVSWATSEILMSRPLVRLSVIYSYDSLPDGPARKITARQTLADGCGFSTLTGRTWIEFENQRPAFGP